MFSGKFDLDKIHTKATGSSNNVSYAVYEESGLDSERTFSDLKKDIAEKKMNGVVVQNICFARLSTKVTKSMNRILFKADFNQCTQEKYRLTLEERVKWVNLCKYHGLMPQNIGKHFVDTGNFVLAFEDLTYTKIYMMLVAARYMQEQPQMPKTALYFHSLGMNFFYAILASTRCTISGTGHSFFMQVKQYCVSNDPHDTTVDIREAITFKKYIRESCEHDKVSFREFLNGGGGEKSFLLHQTIQKIVGGPCNKSDVKIPSLFEKEHVDKIK